MTNKHCSHVRTRYLLSPALALIASLAFVHSTQAATLFWDTNGGTAGFDATAGQWGVDAFWSTDSAGTSVPAVTLTTSADNVNFGTATLGFGATTINLATGTTANVKDITFGAANTGSFVIQGGNGLALAAGSTLTVADSADTASISSVISGTTFTKAGTGTLTLSGANTNTGTTTVSSGVLRLQGAAFSGTARTYSIESGGVLNLNGASQVANGATTINGAGTLRITGGAFSNSVGAGRNVSISMANNGLIDIQSGGSIFNGGWQVFSWGSNRANLNVDGSLDLSDGNSVVVGALTGSGTVRRTSSGNNPTLTVGQNNASGTFSGVLALPGGGTAFSFIKTGTGTQTLTGVNTNTGSITVNNGTLALSGSGSINASASLTVASGATFTNTGVGFNKALIVTEGSLFTGTSANFTPTSLTISGNLANGFSSLDFVSSLTKSGLLTVNFTNTTVGTYNLISSSTTGLFTSVSISGTALASTDSNATFAGSNGVFNDTFTNAGNSLQISAVPEPSTYAVLAGLGVLVLAVSRRRRDQN